MSDNTDEILLVASENYREGKELFAINVYGCSISDILLTIMIMPFLFSIYHELCKIIRRSNLYANASKHALMTFHFLLEFVTFIIPAICVCTFFNDRKYLYLGLFITWISLIVVNRLCSYFNLLAKANGNILDEETVDGGRKGFITAFRGVVVLYTYELRKWCVSILAVDFTIFPRKYAKTYLSGYSLMDIGVGMYIFTSGLVSGIKLPEITHFIKREIMLLALAVGRIGFVKVTDYVVNVLEYGTHWNFFFTLTFVLAGGYVIQSITSSRKYLALIAAIIILYYQGLLSFGISEYIREAKNFSWIDLNAPGMFSSFGFLALFVAAAYIGKLCNEDQISYRLIRLIALTIVMGICFFVFHHYVDEANRRLCNAAFVFLVLFISLIIIVAGYVINACYRSMHMPMILSAMNNHQLFTFMIANLITGGVNLTIKTLFVSQPLAFVILVAYMLVVSICSCVVDKWVDKKQSKPKSA